jgi:hypothetical protein
MDYESTALTAELRALSFTARETVYSTWWWVEDLETAVPRQYVDCLYICSDALLGVQYAKLRCLLFELLI